MTEAVAEILSEFVGDGVAKDRRSASLLPVLQRVQRKLGYIPREVVPQIAASLGVSESQIMGVATFYSQFRFAPAARNRVTVCRGTACHVRRSGKLLDELSQALGIAPGETAADLSFSLDTIACFGSCALAPVVVVNEKVHGRMTKAKALKAVEEAKRRQDEESEGAGRESGVEGRSCSGEATQDLRESERPAAASTAAGKRQEPKPSAERGRKRARLWRSAKTRDGADGGGEEVQQ